MAQSPQLHLVHEPVNHEATLSFRTVPMRHVYELAEGETYDYLREGMMQLMQGRGLFGEAARRLLQVRSLRDAARIVRLLQRELPMQFQSRPAIFKAPLLAFTARTMQQEDGMKVVLGLRHPCAWIESVVRRDGGFDFSDLLQPALLEALPDLADQIRDYAAQRRDPLAEATLLWLVIHTFHARYLIDDPRTLVVRQEDLVADPLGLSDRLFAFAGVEAPAGLDDFLSNTFASTGVDFRPGQGSYVRRDAQALLQKWQRRVSAADQASIRAATGELAARFGYGPEAWIPAQA